jgi:hypothetical protein
MTPREAHVWAIGYDNPCQAEHARAEVTRLAGVGQYLVSDNEGDMRVILHAIRGPGGTVLKTSVDLERAKLIQATLSAEPVQSSTLNEKAKLERAPSARAP